MTHGLFGGLDILVNSGAKAVVRASDHEEYGCMGVWDRVGSVGMKRWSVSHEKKVCSGGT